MLKIFKKITLVMLCLGLFSTVEPNVLSPLDSNSVVEASVLNNATYVKVSTKVYTSRSSKSKSVMVIPQGKSVERLAVHKSWAQIRYNGKSGWVASRNLVEITKTEVLDTKKATKMYSSRSTKAKVVTNIPADASVTRLAVNKSWTQVRYNGKIGWVASSQLKIRYTKETFAPRTYRMKEDTTLKARYVSSSEELVSIPKGTIITSSERYNTWYKVSFEGKTGWVIGKHITSYKETNKDIALKVFGNEFEISGDGHDIYVEKDEFYAYFSKNRLNIRGENIDEFRLAALYIDKLNGCDLDIMTDYMWNARPGGKYATGIMHYNYEISFSPRGGVVVAW